MTIQEKVKSELKSAMINKQKAITSLLRVLIGEFNRVGKEVNDAEATAIIKKMAQNARDQGIATEVEILEKFLPQQLTEDQLTMLIQDMIEETGVDSMRGMGQIMGMLKNEYAGRYDGKLASQIIKNLFS